MFDTYVKVLVYFFVQLIEVGWGCCFCYKALNIFYQYFVRVLNETICGYDGFLLRLQLSLDGCLVFMCIIFYCYIVIFSYCGDTTFSGVSLVKISLFVTAPFFFLYVDMFILVIFFPIILACYFPSILGRLTPNFLSGRFFFLFFVTFLVKFLCLC